MARERKAADVERVAIVLLYDPVSGAIVHAHYAAADPGSELPGRQALERQAVEHAKRRGAKRHGVAVEKLRRLHVAPREFRADRAYKVDVRTRSLVAVSRRKSRPGRRGR
jgi:hypothetical protein